MAEDFKKKYREAIKANKQLQEEKVKLIEMDNLKSKFLANMTHELRTPLSAIIGFSHILLEGMDGEISDKQKEDITFIKKSGEKLMEHINDLLDFSKIEAGMVQLHKEKLHIHSLAEDILQITKATIRKKEIHLVQEIDQSLPPVLADRVRFRQVMLNLLSNAVKYTDEGEIKVKATILDKRGHMEFSISDTGIGIKRKDFSAIFEPFRQVHTCNKRRHEGTGLGLAISKSFIEMHGGEIWFKSKVNKGTTFYFTLPIQ